LLFLNIFLSTEIHFIILKFIEINKNSDFFIVSLKVLSQFHSFQMSCSDF
jgi:hypothetical protein